MAQAWNDHLLRLVSWGVKQLDGIDPCHSSRERETRLKPKDFVPVKFVTLQGHRHLLAGHFRIHSCYHFVMDLLHSGVGHVLPYQI